MLLKKKDLEIIVLGELKINKSLSDLGRKKLSRGRSEGKNKYETH